MAADAFCSARIAKAFRSLSIIAMLLPATPVAAVDYTDNPPPLEERVTPEVLQTVFPGSVRLEPIDGPPKAVAVFDDAGALTGYVFSTLDIVRARGFTSTPFDVLAGIDLSGRIMGAAIVFNPEPHIDGDARRTAMLTEYFSRFSGAAYNRLSEAAGRPDIVSGATISARAMRYAVTDAARIVMRTLVGAEEVTEPTIDAFGFTPMSRDELIAQGSLSSIVLTNSDVTAALAEAGEPDAILATAMRGGPDEVYIEFFAGLGTPPTVSRNLVNSPAVLARILSDMPEGGSLIMLGSRGRYNFQGVSFQNASTNYLFDRVDIVQGDETYVFRGDSYTRAPSALSPYSGILTLAPDLGFDPLAPWSAVLKVHGTTVEGDALTLAFPLEHEVPAAHVLMPEPPPEPIWMAAWRDARTELTVLGFALLALTLFFVFQFQLTRSRVAHRWIRTGFLLFTLVWLGYIAGAQLSIVHVVNYAKAPFEGMELSFFLAEPLIFVLAVYALISVVLIGRGVFCGWLCPFGALQELISKIGRIVRLPEWNPPQSMQQWLWLPKYGALATVVGAAFLAPELASATEEVEPFKTAITAAFSRPWPYVTYAALLLFFSLFTERAFCRFLCPLGATLALLDRIHLLTLLKRRPECGTRCHLCESSCPVKAIKPSGVIVTAECFQCLDCQVEYYDERRCPPLAWERRRGGKRPAAGEFAPA